MKAGQRILAVVPARSGSKGIPDKNLQELAGCSLIGWAARMLQGCAWVDCAVLSTDSPRYVEEARRWGLEAPFMRPPELSTDAAGAVETIAHALLESERIYGERYDIVLIVEPTCPFRLPEDLATSVDLLVAQGGDSVVTVSRLDTKFHPWKALKVEGGRIQFAAPEGAGVVRRQSLPPLYYRNGACYALRRACVLDKRAIFTEATWACVVERPLVNIDEPEDLEWARYLAEVKKLPLGGAKQP